MSTNIESLAKKFELLGPMRQGIIGSGSLKVQVLWIQTTKTDDQGTSSSKKSNLDFMKV